MDDDLDLCKSLRWLLESVGLTTQIFNHAASFLEAFPFSQTEGCILLDIRMPQMSGLELQAQLNVRQNSLPIIFMTGHGDIPMAVRAMQAGAFDFLTKPFNDQILLDLIYKAIAYHQKSLSRDRRDDVIRSRLTSLTGRETEILKWIVAGKLNKEIAWELSISIKTVELHRCNIMKKMHAATVVELIKSYLRVTSEFES
ncbi:MAG: luxR [Gammaproteobacteria bacterium]|nr:luxR [Gammaproteobacteria bacterium]